jgi:aminoglycoside phosphotransferase (APT) family kinase protein
VARAGQAWSLVGRLEGGFQQGAFLVEDATGRRAVLKRSHRGSRRPVTEVSAIVEQARSAGWPTPRWLSCGTTDGGFQWWLAEFVEGSVPDRVDRRFVRAVLPVIQRQAALRPHTDQNWSAYAMDVVFRGASAFMPTVAAFSPTGARLVRAIERTTRRDDGCALSEEDLVHGNLDPGNVIFRGDEIVAVVDVEAIGKGSRAVDIAGLVVSAGVWGDEAWVDELLAASCAAAGEAGTRIVVGAAAIALVAFGTQHWPNDVDHVAARCVEIVAALR